MEINWVEGFAIEVRKEGDAVVLAANREGLLSLAGILTALASEPRGAHLHLDRWNSLEDGSADLILEKTGDRPPGGGK